LDIAPKSSKVSFILKLGHLFRRNNVHEQPHTPSSRMLPSVIELLETMAHTLKLRELALFPSQPRFQHHLNSMVKKISANRHALRVHRKPRRHVVLAGVLHETDSMKVVHL
jgi:hypothetical protein